MSVPVLRDEDGRPRLPANRELMRLFALIGIALVLGYAVVLARSALIQVFMAVLAAIVMEPLVRLVMRRLHVGRGIAVLTSLGGVLLCLLVAASLVIVPLYSSARDLVDGLPGVVDEVQNNSTVQELDPDGDFTGSADDASQWFRDNLPNAAETLLGIAGSLVGAGFAAFNVLFMTLFLLLEGKKIEGFGRGYLARDTQIRIERVTGEITRLVGSYFIGVFIIAAIAGTVMYIAMRILDVPFASGLAVVVAVLDMVPMIGATIAGSLVVLVALSVSVQTAVIMAIVVIVYQQIENNVTQPLVQKQAVDLSPFVIMASVVVGTSILGVLGAFLAVPAAAAIRVVAEEFVAIPGRDEDDAPEPEPAA
jgi:predicted PurR-regulated permease PerM